MTTSTLVYVDRDIPPVYPENTLAVFNPALETNGSSSFDLSYLALCKHPKQLGGRICGVPHVNGLELYQYLMKHGLLDLCLNVRDLEEIQKISLEVYRKFFSGLHLWAFRNPILTDLALEVPYLRETERGLELDWFFLDSILSDENVVVLHIKDDAARRNDYLRLLDLFQVIRPIKT